MAIQTINPSPVMGGTSYNLSSSYAYAHMPEVRKELIQRFGNQDFFTGFFDLLNGGVAPVSSLEYHHLEDDWLHTIVKVNAHAAGAANDPVELTVQSGYTLTYPATANAPYISTGTQTTAHPVQVNDVVSIGGVQCHVVDITPTTFTAQPKVTGENIPAVTTATEVVIYGNENAEGSGQPKSNFWRPVQYTNNMQELKAKFSTSAREMQINSWVDYPQMGGGTKRLIWGWQQFKNYMKYRNEIAATLITGKKITNTVLANTIPTTIATEGMDSFVENYGNNHSYNALLGLQKSDFSTITITMIDKYKGAKEYACLCGINVRDNMSSWIGDAMKNGAVSYGMFGGDKQKAINFDYDSFTLNGYTFHLKTYEPFNYIGMMGAAGQPYPYMMLMMPVDRVAATLGGGERADVPSGRVVYLKHPQAPGSEWMVEWATGAAGGAWTSEDAVFNQNFRSTCGFEGFAANRWVRVTKA